MNESRTRGELTELLGDLSAGKREALDRLMPIIYDELRAIAHRQLRHERSGHTLSTTALVNEAYLKLVNIDRIQWKDRAHFFAVAARAMRRILIDYADMKNAQKRGGGVPDVSLNEVVIAANRNAEDLLLLNDALTQLEQVNERHGRIVECRFFAGMSIEETAQALEISAATVKREWALARAWLNRELSV